MKNLNICTRWKPLVFDAFRKKCKLSEFSDCFKYLIVKLRKILWWVTYTYTTRIPILKNCIFYDQCHRKLIDLEVLKFEYLSWLYSLRLWSRQILYLLKDCVCWQKNNNKYIWYSKFDISKWMSCRGHKHWI